MKKFDDAEIELILLAVVDLLTISDDDPEQENPGGMDPD